MRLDELAKEFGDDVQFLAPGGVRELEVMDVSYHPQPPLPEGEMGWRED